MAIDNKYGRVTTERGDISEDEPVVVFRAKDKLLPSVLIVYSMLCQAAGSPEHHLDLITDTTEQVLAWQEQNPVQVPTSSGYMSGWL